MNGLVDRKRDNITKWFHAPSASEQDASQVSEDKPWAHSLSALNL
jgi:hypothetical protein